MGIKKGEKYYLELFKNKHNNKYEYPAFTYKSNKDKIKIICPEHGEFEQTISNHSVGKGCNKCARILTGLKRRNKIDELKKIFLEVHGDKYSYNKFIEYKQAHEKVEIYCNKHKKYFSQSVNSHKRGIGCPLCGRERSEEAKTLDIQSFIEKANTVHNNIYDYSKVIYTDSKENIIIVCKKHRDFNQSPNNHLMGKGCPKCTTNISKAEEEISNFLKEHLEVKQSDREQLGIRELDIFIPEKKLAIEYNGLYWHSEKFKDKKYHQEKRRLCESKGIKLLQIFEDEWLLKKEIVKSRLINEIGGNTTKIYARNCVIREVNSKDSNKFLEINHIQGKLNSRIRLGLYYKDELVSLMTFGGLRKNLGQHSKEGSYELLRFCSKLNINVAGGASKLNSYFEKTFKPKETISYADLRWSSGKVYYNLGFKLEHTTEPNYFYTKGITRENRFNYRKSELIKKGFDKNKTEREIMLELGYNRIYDAGALKFIKLFN